VGAVLFSAEVEAGANVAVFGLGGIGLNVIQGLKMAGADKIIGVDINDSKEEWGRRFGMTHFVNPKTISDDVVAHLVNLTEGGADYTFDCTGNTGVMRTAWRSRSTRVASSRRSSSWMPPDSVDCVTWQTAAACVKLSDSETAIR
jgi:Zn-dependent alcohol dehydrogenase